MSGGQARVESVAGAGGLLLRWSLRSGVVDAEADLHGGVLGENNVTPTRNEMRVDGHACTARSHGITERAGLNKRAEQRADEFIAADAAGHPAACGAAGIGGLGVRIASCGKPGETNFDGS